MTAGHIVMKLTKLGFRFRLDGEVVKVRLTGEQPQDPAAASRLLELVRQHRDQVRAYLKTLVVCQDCVHAQVGQGWALCQAEPWDGIPGQTPDFPHPCRSFTRRPKPSPPPEKILSCDECPWYAENPWTHYPALPAWCQYHIDHLLQDNPACIGFRRREIPNPAKNGVVRCPRTNETQEIRRLATTGKITFNRTNENIEWAKWTWNPVTGCLHGCPYCYARPIAKQIYPPEIGFNPHFYHERLTAPKNTPVPKSEDVGEHNVFVSSMGDLFGEWVPLDWINAVLEAMRQAPQWNFLFLTKNPKRLVGIEWPQNAWVGTTVDVQSRVAPAEEAFRQIKATVKFVSCEPLLEELTFSHLEVFDWVIIGGCRRPGQRPEEADQPDWPWVLSLDRQARQAGIMRYWKPNLKVPREFSLAEVPKEFPTAGQKNGRMP